MTLAQIIQAAIPGADDAVIEHVLWSRTTYPFEWMNARILYHAARRLDRATRHNLKLCDLCDRRISQRRFVCCRCAAALRPEP